MKYDNIKYASDEERYYAIDMNGVPRLVGYGTLEAWNDIGAGPSRRPTRRQIEQADQKAVLDKVLSDIQQGAANLRDLPPLARDFIQESMGQFVSPDKADQLSRAADDELGYYLMTHIPHGWDDALEGCTYGEVLFEICRRMAERRSLQ